jgi:hypothetical protein
MQNGMGAKFSLRDVESVDRAIAHVLPDQS